MLNSLRIENFKSWKDTGDIQFGAITGFFGTNSSGKTSILQFLLMLKQTVESLDRSQILNLGDERSYVELGTFDDIIYQHKDPSEMSFVLRWANLDTQFESNGLDLHYFTTPYEFSALFTNQADSFTLEKFTHTSYSKELVAERQKKIEYQDAIYKMFTRIPLGVHPDRRYIGEFNKPIKFYGFPNSVYHNHPNLEDEITDFEQSFYQLFDRIYYLGPLRDYPKRLYPWSGESTQDVGKRGENTIAALLTSRKQGKTIRSDGKKSVTLDQHVAYWLKELGLIHSFAVRPIAPKRKEYEVRVRRTKESAEVFLTDVGFGVSQLLPVLVLLFYVPEGSTIILEQPEIHLHPAVQAGLADVFIDAIKRRNVQIILESHSEHLLQRLQLRLAEKKMTANNVKLYFTEFTGAASNLTPLDLDQYGNIRNWPKDFFGNPFGEAAARMREEIKQRQAAGEK